MILETGAIFSFFLFFFSQKPREFSRLCAKLLPHQKYTWSFDDSIRNLYITDSILNSITFEPAPFTHTAQARPHHRSSMSRLPLSTSTFLASIPYPQITSNINCNIMKSTSRYLNSALDSSNIPPFWTAPRLDSFVGGNCRFSSNIY